MLSEIFTFIFALAGIVFIFHTFLFKVTLWLTESFTTSIPLHEDNENIFDRVYKLYSLYDFCGLNKKCTIVIINYGASAEFVNELKEYYAHYNNLRIIQKEELPEKLIKG